MNANLTEPSPTTSLPVLAAHGIRKQFASVLVLDGVRFEVRGGEVHTLMGENGAGKSTLMKILAGVHRPDAGRLLLDGNEVAIASPHAATKLGIALIHQEPLSFPDLSVAENIFLARDTPRGRLGQIDWLTMRRRARELLDSLGIDLDPRTPMRGLSIADQQMVELAAALSQQARVLLMDEPTAALTPQEVEKLFAIVRRLKSQGVAIVFISHRLPEVFAISDRITVLRDGHFVGTRAVSETTTDEIVQMMVGRPLSTLYDRPHVTPGEVVLRVDRLSRAGQFADISLEVRAGEIVGLAGLVGAGRTEVAQAIFGATRADSGTVSLDGKSIRIRSPKDAVAHGIAYVPEDRAEHGVLLPMSIASNTSLASLRGVSKMGVLSASREHALAESWRGKLQTRLRDVEQPVAELSGGNQQKVVLAKWLETKPRVLIVDEPTRGIDIGAKAEVHHVLAELAKGGTAILMISSDLPEVLAMSDRVLVMREGRLAGEFTRDEATQERVMTAATLGAHTQSSRPTAADPAGSPAKRSLLARSASAVLHLRELGVFVFVLLLFALVTWKNPEFISSANLRSILIYLPLILIVAIGQLLVIVSRNIDLSVGSMLALSAMVAGGMFISRPELPIAVAALVAVGVGALLGLFNGVLVTLLRVPAIIATLGTLTAYRGLTYIYSGSRQVNNNDLPRGLLRLATDGPLNVPWLVWIAAIVAVFASLFLRYTTTGRQIFAIGSNPRAAELRGVPVRRVMLLVFTLSGALAGLAGILFGARFGTINPSSVGQQMELISISAVVLGGAAVNGGAGSILGTVLGCLLLAIVGVALPMLRIDEFWQRAFYGFAILIACILDAALRQRRRAGVLR